ncbi:MAG: ferredoxin [Spirochaetia bacterium]|nr:ferredoxin [Spirochaetia bacterium]
MIMKEYVKNAVNEYWKSQCSEISQKFNETALKLKNIIDTENYYREEHKDEAKLKKALGEFTINSIDEKKLASVLSKGDDKRAMPESRFKRVKSAHAALTKAVKEYAEASAKPVFEDLKNDANSIIDSVEKHLNQNSDLIKQYRIGNLEVKAHYNEEVHDKFFKNFDWKKMNDEEISFCTPYIIFAQSSDETHDLGDIVKLISLGRPVKLCMLQDSFIEEGEGITGRAAALKLHPDLGFLGVSLRKIFVAQGSIALSESLNSAIASGIASGRPALISIFSANASSQEELKKQAELALKSRTFTHLVYDPDKSADFVKCLDISMNPELEAYAPNSTVAFVSGSGEKSSEAYSFTFADFVKSIGGFEKEYELLKEEKAGKHVTLYEYLNLNYENRVQKVPVIHAINGDNKIKKYIVPKNVVALTTDKFHLWKTFQQLAGVRNPFVIEIEQKTKEALADEKDKAVNDVKAKMTAEMQQKTKEAVTGAMRNLAMKLTGLSDMMPAAVSKPAVVSASASASAAKEPAADTGQASEEAWVETELCTACDECIMVNKSIFVYDGNKQVVIKNAKGGPYRDLVKAAEKCPVKIIHPGLPWDSSEKDVEKWKKRGEKFN